MSDRLEPAKFGALAEGSRRGRALGAALSVAVHAAVAVPLVFMVPRSGAEAEPPHSVAVAFVRRPPAPSPGPGQTPSPAPPPPGRAHAAHRPAARRRVSSSVPKPLPASATPSPSVTPHLPDIPDEDEADEPGDQASEGLAGDDEGGDPSGEPGGQVGGQSGGRGAGPGGGSGEDSAVYFGEGMTRPRLDPDDLPTFPWAQVPNAVAAHVEGLILATCEVTSEGVLRDCQVLRSLPHVPEAVVLRWLGSWRLHPALQGNRPISIRSFSIPIRLRQPNR